MSALPAIDETGARRPGRCPACRARTSAGQQWCSLCHADLSPPPAGTSPEAGVTSPEASVTAATEDRAGIPGAPDGADETEPGPTAGSGSPPADAAPGGPIGTGTTPGRILAADDAVLAALPQVDHLLAELAAAERDSRIQATGRLGSRLSELTTTPLRRAMTTLALGVVVLGCLVLGSVLLGWVL
jgi:hypothetical protein